MAEIERESPLERGESRVALQDEALLLLLRPLARRVHAHCDALDELGRRRVVVREVGRHELGREGRLAQGAEDLGAVRLLVLRASEDGRGRWKEREREGVSL